MLVVKDVVAVAGTTVVGPAALAIGLVVEVVLIGLELVVAGILVEDSVVVVGSSPADFEALVHPAATTTTTKANVEILPPITPRV